LDTDADVDDDPDVGVSLLFMLFIRSRTVLFLPPDGVTESTLLAGFPADCESPRTVVSSPDFLSTPTIDQGRGLGKGFGLRGPKFSDAEGMLGAAEIALERVLGSGEVPPGMLGENLFVLRPTMDPLGSSFGTTDTVGVFSEVGDVRFPTNPVDLYNYRKKEA